MSVRTLDLMVYTVYDNPSDYPGKIVVRRHMAGICEERGPVVVVDAEPMFVCDDIEQARQRLPPGLTNIGRQPNDDPVIAEVWI